MAGRLAGRTAVVTGGASGLGRAIALRFADEGAFVVVGDVRAEPREGGPATAELLGERGLMIEADASRWEDIDRLVTSAIARRERLDVMGCNPGIAGAAERGDAGVRQTAHALPPPRQARRRRRRRALPRLGRLRLRLWHEPARRRWLDGVLRQRKRSERRAAGAVIGEDDAVARSD